MVGEIHEGDVNASILEIGESSLKIEGIVFVRIEISQAPHFHLIKADVLYWIG